MAKRLLVVIAFLLPLLPLLLFGAGLWLARQQTQPSAQAAV